MVGWKKTACSLHPLSNCSWNLLFHLQQKGSPKTNTYSSVKVLPPSLKPALNVKCRQVPVPQFYCRTFSSSSISLHSCGCCGAPWALRSCIPMAVPLNSHHSRGRWSPSDAGTFGAIGIKISCDIQHKVLAPELMSKVEVQQVLLWLIFKWDFTTVFFNIQFRFLCWIFGRGNCLANFFHLLYTTWKNVNY